MSIDLPPARPSWTRWIVDYNPCFLLSAICMLVGCRILNDTVNSRPGDLWGACWLVLTINVYELSLLGVAALIRRWQGMRRDVGILLVVGSIFLCDVTFVVGDLSTANSDMGIVMAALLTLSAVPKAWITLRLIDSPKLKRVTAMVAAQVAVLVLLPVVLKKVSLMYSGFLPATAIYATWWFVGALPIVGVIVLGWRSVERLGGLAVTYLTVPYLLIIGHLLACTWVFHLKFYAAYYTPVMLGLAVAAGMLRRRISRENAMTIEWVLSITAMVVSVHGPAELTLIPYLTPLRMAAIGTALVNLHGLLTTWHPLFALTLISLGMGAVFGPLWQFIAIAYRWVMELLMKVLRLLIPQTYSQWGIAAVGTSFVLLVIGSVISLWKRPAREA